MCMLCQVTITACKAFKYLWQQSGNRTITAAGKSMGAAPGGALLPVHLLKRGGECAAWLRGYGFPGHKR